MYQELYEYFIQHGELHLPGIGTLALEREPARADFASRVMIPPAYAISLHHGPEKSPRSLYQWLSSAFLISEPESVVRFNDFVFEMKRQLIAGSKLQWDGVGTLSKGLAGEIRFESAKLAAYTEPLPVAKILRDDAEHLVRIGEEQRFARPVSATSADEPAANKWFWPLIILLLSLAIIFIGYYFSEQGVDPLSTGNRQLLIPDNSPAPNIP